MQLHELTRTHKNTDEKRVGRGGRRGKTSGRGHKGQRSRAGHRIRPQARDLIKKLPKLRGHGIHRSASVHSGREPIVPVNLSTLEQTFDANAEVTPKALVARGIVTKRGGRVPAVKILGDGALTKPLSISGCRVSAAAQEAITQAGGTVAA